MFEISFSFSPLPFSLPLLPSILPLLHSSLPLLFFSPFFHSSLLLPFLSSFLSPFFLTPFLSSFFLTLFLPPFFLSLFFLIPHLRTYLHCPGLTSTLGFCSTRKLVLKSGQLFQFLHGFFQAFLFGYLQRSQPLVILHIGRAPCVRKTL